MTVQEVFSQLVAHMVKGLMVHSQLADYYTFLGFEGYRLEHEHQYEEESKSYRAVTKYFMTHCDMLLPSDKVNNPEVIPAAWYKYNRYQVDINTKQNGVEAGFKIWKDWETDSLKLYEKLAKDLYDFGDISAYHFLIGIIENVEKELQGIKDSVLLLNATNYDMTYISECQKELIEKHKD